MSSRASTTEEIDDIVYRTDARRRRRSRDARLSRLHRTAAAPRSTMSSATASPATGRSRTATSSISTSPPMLDGWHGDTSRMYLVGDVPVKARRLVDVTYECLMLGHRAGEAGQPSRRHRPRHPEPCREAPLRRRPRFLRPRPRPGVPRRARSRPCRPPRHRPRAAARHVLHDRADDQHRQARREAARRRLDRGHPRPLASPPSSSIRSASPRTAARSSRSSPTGLDKPPY